MELVQFRPEEVLVEAGAADCPGYFIAEGRVEEIRDSQAAISHGVGSLVVSIGTFADSRPAPYTLRAASKGKAFLLRTEAFNQFLHSYPGIYLQLLHHR